MSITGLAKTVALSALTVSDDESSVAFGASSTVVPVSAVVTDGNALSLTVEDESVGTFQTNLLVPIPSATAEVSNLLKRSKFASSSNKSVSFVARNTVSGNVESGALI